MNRFFYYLLTSSGGSMSLGLLWAHLVPEQPASVLLTLLTAIIFSTACYVLILGRGRDV